MQDILYENQTNFKHFKIPTSWDIIVSLKQINTPLVHHKMIFWKKKKSEMPYL